MSSRQPHEVGGETKISDAADGLAPASRGRWAPATACAGCPRLLRLHVRNAGTALWKGRGEIQLEAHWMNETGRHVGEASLPLEADVYPGEETVVGGAIPSPASPGSYLLGLELVSGTGARLGARDSAVERVEVTVR